MKKYYKAYDERYKKVHEEQVLWFSKEPTPELGDWIKEHNISYSETICELGCGEGRDALNLATQGYRIVGIDISEAAIKKCRELSNEKGITIDWIVGDATCLAEELKKKFRWVYSIATLHMLVLQEDRDKFLQMIYEILEPNGKAMILIMGDGKTERMTDIDTSFDIRERIHSETGRKMEVAGTSYRAINWDDHLNELRKAGFNVEKQLETTNNEYGRCMVVYLGK